MLEVEIAGAVEVEALTPNAEVVTVETAGVEEAFVAKENPDPKEAVEIEEGALAGAVGAADEATVVGAVDAAGAPNAGPEDDRLETPLAGVEAVVVVTVENSGAEDVAKEKEPGCFEAGVPEAAEAVEAEAEADAALLKANEG